MFRAIALALTLMVTSVAADTLKIIVPSDNDSYNINARVLGKYLVKHLPNQPTLVIQSMPGAASMVAANYLYNHAPKDGSVIGTFYKEIPLVGALGGPNVQYDASKFTWIGSNVDGRKDAVIMWCNTDNPKIIGSENYAGVNPAFLVRDLAKLDAKIVTGYATTGDARLALERKEVDAVVYNLIGIKTQKPQWLKPDSGIKACMQFGNGTNRHPEYKDVQALAEVVQSDMDKTILSTVEESYAMLRPFVAPPGIPAKNTKEFREAFAKALADPEYMAEAMKMNIEVNMIDYNEAEKLVTYEIKIGEQLVAALKRLNEANR
jgi:hypothetical protein